MGSQGVVGVLRVVKYYYSLFCTGSVFESGDFSREIEQFSQNVAVNGNFLDKRNFGVND